jgi:hypothetical protein
MSIMLLLFVLLEGDMEELLDEDALDDVDEHDGELDALWLCLAGVVRLSADLIGSDCIMNCSTPLMS